MSLDFVYHVVSKTDHCLVAQVAVKSDSGLSEWSPLVEFEHGFFGSQDIQPEPGERLLFADVRKYGVMHYDAWDDAYLCKLVNADGQAREQMVSANVLVLLSEHCVLLKH